MARPRIFISSTFYDLRYARVSLESFIREMGYEPVMNERGHIPYGTEQLEKYCYQEISKVSMLISIIGGRYGTESKENSVYSISNIELKTAMDLGKQVYICIDSGVYGEFSTYRKNKGKEIEFSHVDNRKVYEFIEEVYDLPRNNQIFPFAEIPTLIAYLKEQWAGLFEGYLESKTAERTFQSITRIENSIKTLDQLVNVIKTEIADKTGNQTNLADQIDQIIIQNHPIFPALKQHLKVTYRIFFATKDEFAAWLKGARNGQDLSDVGAPNEDFFEFSCMLGKDRYWIDMDRSLFDENGNLKPMQPASWNDALLSVYKAKSADEEDDIPF